MVLTDTSKESEKVLLELYRTMSAAKKASLIFNACRMGRQLALAGLKDRFPKASPEQLWHLWARQHLGQTLYEQVYGDGRA
ncbi:MAG: hypothetical protein LLF76_06995 [Planctomycetaceae bacterium]|nr:hypothetical protein [Planctomycetaceae bacterium]